MADDPIPWMVGGGIKHSVEVGRLLAYAGFGGNEGVVGPKDLEIREGSGASAAPTNGVRAFPGAAAIINRSTQAAYEAYATRFPLVTNVPIAATSGSPRNDLIVARIENPYDGDTAWTAPTAAQIAAGLAAFRFVRVISGVAATVKTVKELANGQSAIPLALVKIPANTSVITQSMITDLRQLVGVRRSDVDLIINPSATEDLTSATMVDWPPSASSQVFIPDWATHFTADATLSGIKFGTRGSTGGGDGFDVLGTLRIALGTLTGQPTAYNLSNEGGMDFINVVTGGQADIPAALRGTTQALRVQGLKSSGDSALSSGTAATIIVRCKFTQALETNL